MKTYKVTINFKGMASFGCEVEAEKPAAAKAEALKFARSCGFTEPVKSYVVNQSEVAA